MKTVNVKAGDVKKSWVLIDAKDQVVGRLATDIVLFLRGKHRPIFTPHLDTGDNVVVINAAKIKLDGGKKPRDRVLYHHTGYMGGIKAVRAENVLQSKPERLLQRAVQGMLPKTKLGRQLLKNLRVFPGAEHTHIAQAPKPAPVRTAKK